MPEGKKSFIERYGVNLTEREYVVNPAIGREKEIRELIVVLLTPEKSAILTGLPGTGKTAIVEGLAYLIQRGEVPDALQGYTIIKVDTQALVGTVQETGDTRVQTLIDEILSHEKYILFIDEIHTLINATSESALDFANMFKTGLGRGDLKVIGATTSEEYERYILRDKAFTRRFQRIDIKEPDKDLTTKIVAGVIPRIEHATGIKMAYTPFIWERLARFVVELTTEYNRVYETAGRYPDVPISLFSAAFSEALFKNKKEVTADDLRTAIINSKAIYPDVIKKYIEVYDQEFKDLLDMEKRDHTGLVNPEMNTVVQKTEREETKLTGPNPTPIDEVVVPVDNTKQVEKPVAPIKEELTNSIKEEPVAVDKSDTIDDGVIDTIQELNDFYDNILNNDNKE